MNNPFEEIFKRLDNIEKLISSGNQPIPKEESENPTSLVKISVASRLTGYSVNYLYHLASTGQIPHVKRGRSLRFDIDELKQWLEQQYIPDSKSAAHEKRKE